MILPLLITVLGYTTGAVEVEPFHVQGDAEEAASEEYGMPSSGIPVICYHHVNDILMDYGVTPSRLRADLEDLYDAGFTLVTRADLENGLMQLPSGRRPLILTFDDGWQDNVNFLENADGSTEIDPYCVVAILEEFTTNHPDFGGKVIFFISWDKIPFGQEEYVEEKLNMLLDMGHEIGNHSWRHRHFITLNGDQWSPAVLRAMDYFYRELGIRTCEISSLAYPGGAIQKGSWVTERIAEMEFNGARAVTMGFLVDGAVSSFRWILGDPDMMLRVSRIDMSLYSVRQLLRWRNLISEGNSRSSLHDPLPWRP